MTNEQTHLVSVKMYSCFSGLSYSLYFLPKELALGQSEILRSHTPFSVTSAMRSDAPAFGICQLQNFRTPEQDPIEGIFCLKQNLAVTDAILPRWPPQATGHKD